MKTYQLQPLVNGDGSIVLPKEIKTQLRKHWVRLTLIDLETLQKNPVKILKEITQAYNHISDEPDLDLGEIYAQREQRNDREALFA